MIDHPQRATVSATRFLSFFNTSLVTFICGIALLSGNSSAEIPATLFQQVQQKVVKIYGAGGLNRLKSYGTGFVVTPEGDIATVWSPVLDTPRVEVVFSNGHRFEGELAGVDPRRDLALIRLLPPAGNQEQSLPKLLPFFDLDREVTTAEPGSRVLAFSNMFRVATGDEPVTVLRGLISAKSRLYARRGASEISFEEPVYLLDSITSNSGAAGGVIVSTRGLLVGVIGKELKNSQTNTWVNYAMPIESLIPSIRQLLSDGTVAIEDRMATSERDFPMNGLTSLELGILMVPDVVIRTPAYIDAIMPQSAAAIAGLQSDDLILFLGDKIISSCRDWQESLARHSREERIQIVVRRQGRLLTMELEAPRVSP